MTPYDPSGDAARRTNQSNGQAWGSIPRRTRQVSRMIVEAFAIVGALSTLWVVLVVLGFAR